MPKRKKNESPEEQSAGFRTEVERMMAARELCPPTPRRRWIGLSGDRNGPPLVNGFNLITLTTKRGSACLVLEEISMNALPKDNVKAVAPVRPTGKKASAREMAERTLKRYPKTMARLAA